VQSDAKAAEKSKVRRISNRLASWIGAGGQFQTDDRKEPSQVKHRHVRHKSSTDPAHLRS
jgi:hypothetical protein